MKRFICILAAVCFLFAGCSKKSDETQNTETKVITKAPIKNDLIKTNKDTLNIGVVVDSFNKNPFEAKNAESVNVLNLVFDSLFSMGAGGYLENSLVESYSLRQDGKFEFVLRNGVTFHNGKEVTSDDVKYSIDLLNSSNTQGSAGATVYSNAKSAIKGFEKIDDKKFALSLSSGGISPLYTLLFPIVPKDGSFCGTGLYKIDSFSNDNIALSYYDKSFKKEPNIKSINVLRYNSHNDMSSAYKSNKVDMLFSDRQYLGLYKYHKNTYTISQRTNEFYFLAPNLSSGTMSNLKMRQVLSYAINKEEIVSRAFDSSAVVTDFPVPADYFIHDTQLATYPVDIGTCKKKLEEMGYTLVKEGTKTYLKKGSQYLTIRIVATKDQEDIAKALESVLSDIGVMVTTKICSFEDYKKDISGKNYDIAVASAVIGSEFDLSFMFTQGSGNLNGAGSSNISSALNAINSQSADFVKIKEGYEKLLECLIKELPITSLCFTTRTIVLSDRVHGASSAYSSFDMLDNINTFSFEKVETNSTNQVVD